MSRAKREAIFSNKTMRAKFQIVSVTPAQDHPQETIEMSAVTEKPFDQDGNSEDNSFAKWTPCGYLKMVITNPALLGAFTPGQKFYLDFTKAEEAPAQQATP